MPHNTSHTTSCISPSHSARLSPATSTIAPPPPICREVSWQVLLGFSIFLFLYGLNALFPAQSDDLNRGFGLLQGAISSYMGWNGRLGELLGVAFGGRLAHTPYFAPLNAAIGTYVIYMFFFLLFGRKPQSNAKDLGIIAGILFVFMLDRTSSFGSIFVWACGSCNYLWAYALIFSFLAPYRIFLISLLTRTPYVQSRAKELWLALGLLLLGILAGWSSEFIVVAIAFLLGLLGVILYARSPLYAKVPLLPAYLKTSQKLPLWYCAGIVGLVVGFLILYAAPGGLVRIGVFRQSGTPFYSFGELLAMSPSELLAWLEFVYGRARTLLCLILLAASGVFLLESRLARYKQILGFVLIGVAIFAARLHTSVAFYLLAIAYCATLALLAHRGGKAPLRRLFVLLGFCVFGVFMYKSANIQMGWLPQRSSLPFTLLHTSMLIALLLYLYETRQNLARLLPPLAGAACVFAACFVLLAYVDMRAKWQGMLSSIATQKAMGAKDIIVDQHAFLSYYNGYGDFGIPGEEPKVWPNSVYAAHFGVESFIATPLLSK